MFGQYDYNPLVGQYCNRNRACEPRRTMSVDIPDHFSAAIQRLISEGKYQNESDIVEEGIRLVIAHERLNAEIQAGINELDAGKSVDATEVYAEARKRIRSAEENQL